MSLASIIRRLLGHKRKELKYDDFPPEIEGHCHLARGAAIGWYIRRYGEHPAFLPVRVVIQEEPRMCGSVLAGAWTSGPQRIDIWRHQRNFDGSLEHEFRHVLCMANGKGGSEEAVR